MALRGYYSHVDPSGHGPNWWVRQAGYPLPDSYNPSPSANNIESITAGRATVDDAWGSWMESSPHRAHLLGEGSFYAGQTSVGVGYAHIPGSQWTDYWVVLTAPPNGPGVTIKTPGANEKVFTSTIVADGRTDGAPAPASVQARIENGGGNGSFETASGTGNWSIALGGLAAGQNTLRVRSLDENGAVLAEETRTIRHTVMAPLTLEISGSGTVSGGFPGTTLLEVGREYTLKARPAEGWLFAGWTGSLSGPNRIATFIMPGDMSLTANFVRNPFSGHDGKFTGLVSGSGIHGLLKVKLTGTGAFTARLRMDGQVVRVAGSFDGNGDAAIAARLANGRLITAALHFDSSAGAPRITGTVSDGSFAASASLNATAKIANGSSPNTGRYTVVFPAQAGTGSGTPDGDGFAALVVTANGSARLAGRLADDTPFSASGIVSESGALDYYIPLYDSAGLLTGTLNFRPLPVSDLDGPVFWSRPAQPGAPLYPAGFEVEGEALGSAYIPPADGQPVLAVPVLENNTTLSLGDGNLPDPVVQPATLRADNRVAVTAPGVPGTVLTIRTNSGKFKGVFTHPATGGPTRFHGIIFQKQNTGFGYFVGPSRSGYTTFEAAE